jgi:LPS export ABC transporter protein LptC/lipopolysaccharide transport protein LptA
MSIISRWKTWVFSTLLILLFFEVIIGFPIPLNTELPGLDADTLPIVNTKGAEQKMQGVHLVESSSGSRDWELFAKSAEGYNGKGIWELTDVKVNFYNADNIEFTVTGKMGSIDSKSKDMRITGGVQTVSSNSYRFQTQTVSYKASTRTLLSPDKVKMTGPTKKNSGALIVTGDSMEMNVNSKLMRIKDHVTAQKTLQDGKNFSISSNGAEFSSESNLARFFDHVTIEVESMRLEGPEASFQYEKSLDFLSSVLVKGGVKVSDRDRFATSEAVKYDPLKNQFVLTGRPRVVQNNDEITGDQIVFFEGGKKVKVENIRAKMEHE